MILPLQQENPQTDQIYKESNAQLTHHHSRQERLHRYS